MLPYPGRSILGILVGLTVGLGRLAAAIDSPATVIAVQVRGSVEVQHGESTASEKVVDGSQLGTADIITTGAQSSVMLVIPNGSVVALKEKSRLKIAVALQSALQGPEPVVAVAAGAEPTEPGVSQTSFELSFGEMLTRVRKLNPSSTFEVQTPVSVAAVRGTVFEISYQPGKAGRADYQLSTASGLVHVTPHAGKLVAVPANERVNLRAEIGNNGVKIKQVRSGKLDRRRQERIQKEGMDNERNAGEMIRRVKPAGPGAGQLEPRGNPSGPVAKPTPPANPPPTVRAAPAPVIKPAVPATKPKLPPKVPAIKRPPRPPGT